MDLTLTATDRGVYETPLTPGAPTTITVEPTGAVGGDGQPKLEQLEVIVHTADAPVYLRPGTTVTVQDPEARMIAPGSFLQYIEAETLTLVCAGNAVVSIARR